MCLLDLRFEKRLSVPVHCLPLCTDTNLTAASCIQLLPRTQVQGSSSPPHANELFKTARLEIADHFAPYVVKLVTEVVEIKCLQPGILRIG